MFKLLKKVLAKLLVSLIYAYKYIISPHIPRSCRYVPSCSDYALEAIKVHGPIRGGFYAGKRILSCHPYGKHGYDPIPPKK